MSCSICLEDLEQEEKEKLDCGHPFHKKCISEWFKRKRICPLCRNPETIIPRPLEPFIETLEFISEINRFEKYSDSMYGMIFKNTENCGVLQLNQDGTMTVSCTRGGKKILNVIHSERDPSY